MEFTAFPKDIFTLLSYDHDIDLRVLRLVAKALKSLPKTCFGRDNRAVAMVIMALKTRNIELARWYYEQTDRSITFADIKNFDPRFTNTWYNHIPKYILTDHPDLSVDPEHIYKYIRILGINQYADLAMTIPPPNFNFGADSNNIYHSIACELVYNCRSVADTYRTFLLLLGHWNAPGKITLPIESNVGFADFTQLQVYTLHFLALCHKNLENNKAVSRLYKRLKIDANVELTVADLYVLGAFLSEQQYLEKMTTAYNDLCNAGMDAVITPTYKITILPRINILNQMNFNFAKK
ncbi:DNA repair nuclease [Faustovirus]|nr:DNA repair nuclease [Faustovirus]